MDHHPRFPNRTPTETPIYRTFYIPSPENSHLSLRVPGKGDPFMFPNMVPLRKILHHHSHWSVSSFMSAGVPKKGTFLQNGEKHKVIVQGAPRRWKAYIQRGTA
jgi:hypothetical protein